MVCYLHLFTVGVDGKKVAYIPSELYDAECDLA